MTKITIALFCIASLALSSCTQTQPTAEERTATKTLAAESSKSTKVTVLFSGLMIFHKEPDKPGYEVGILATPDVKRKHSFNVAVGKEVKKLPNGPSWTMEITNATPTTAIAPHEVGHASRLEDNEQNQFDFSWLIDLEGPEFHNKELDLKPGLLRPIIHLPNGRFYTHYKSIDLKRSLAGKSSEFGFVPETMALDLDLNEGQELVLKDDQGGPGSEVFRLAYDAKRPTAYLVIISNMRTPTRESDFGLYYDLFNGISDKEKYDFSSNEGSGRSPHNPYPFHLDTCCMMACTACRLGRRIRALE